MKVLCIENVYRENELTIDEEYEVLHESNSMYRILNDNGDIIHSSKWRFSKAY